MTIRFYRHNACLVNAILNRNDEIIIFRGRNICKDFFFSLDFEFNNNIIELSNTLFDCFIVSFHDLSCL